MTKTWVETQSNRRRIDSITVRVIHRMPITNKLDKELCVFFAWEVRDDYH